MNKYMVTARTYAGSYRNEYFETEQEARSTANQFCLNFEVNLVEIWKHGRKGYTQVEQAKRHCKGFPIWDSDGKQFIVNN